MAGKTKVIGDAANLETPGADAGSGTVTLKALDNLPAEMIGAEHGSDRVDRGDTFEAPDKATADALVASGHAEHING